MSLLLTVLLFLNRVLAGGNESWGPCPLVGDSVRLVLQQQCQANGTIPIGKTARRPGFDLCSFIWQIMHCMSYYLPAVTKHQMKATEGSKGLLGLVSRYGVWWQRSRGSRGLGSCHTAPTGRKQVEMSTRPQLAYFYHNIRLTVRVGLPTSVKALWTHSCRCPQKPASIGRSKSSQTDN